MKIKKNTLYCLESSFICLDCEPEPLTDFEDACQYEL